MNTIFERLSEILVREGLMICSAESCTGGLFASKMTDQAGSSAYIAGGVVAYSNEVKQSVLGVKESTLIAHGAVSAETAAEMAEGALGLFGCDFAVSVTGIAGPGGGSEEKPVGLTYIGLAGKHQETHTRKMIWPGSRLENKMASAEAMAHLLIEVLLGT